MWTNRYKRLDFPVAASPFPLRPCDHLAVGVEEPRIVDASALERPIEPDHGIMAVAAVVLWSVVIAVAVALVVALTAGRPWLPSPRTSRKRHSKHGRGSNMNGLPYNQPVCLHSSRWTRNRQRK